MLGGEKIDINAEINSNQITPLAFAVAVTPYLPQESGLRIIDLLLQAGANPYKVIGTGKSRGDNSALAQQLQKQQKLQP